MASAKRCVRVAVLGPALAAVLAAVAGEAPAAPQGGRILWEFQTGG